jgi:hypothetical protein
MKLLLDENLPHALRDEIPGHAVFTLSYMGWSAMRNGQLLESASAAGLEAMLTMDASIPHQHDITRLPVAVIVLSAASNDIADIRPLIPAVLNVLSSLVPATVVFVS